jgi:hypothetical protein
LGSFNCQHGPLADAGEHALSFFSHAIDENQDNLHRQMTLVAVKRIFNDHFPPPPRITAFQAAAHGRDV